MPASNIYFMHLLLAAFVILMHGKKRNFTLPDYQVQYTGAYQLLKFMLQPRIYQHRKYISQVFRGFTFYCKVSFGLTSLVEISLAFQPFCWEVSMGKPLPLPPGDQ